MEVSNDGRSFYHRFLGSFFPGPDGQLLLCIRPRQQWNSHHWDHILAGNHEALANKDVRVFQSSLAAHGNRTAVMVSCGTGPPEDLAFDEYFARLILNQAQLCAPVRSPGMEEGDSTADRVAELFDSYLRYRGSGDRWAVCGRAYFSERIRHFTAQAAPIEFCLPAFPCKSSNRCKVTGPAPDRGEELALERLHGFLEAIEAIYAPGAKLWIVSDGHVFSDCIGVDDTDVDGYGERLKEMNHAVGLRWGSPDRVGFRSLVDLLQLDDVESEGGLAGLAGRLNIPEVDHHVDTKVTEAAELCRRILMAGCGPRRSAVRATIDSKDPTITALYRGFSRFMLEDLENHPQAKCMTRSQQKKLSSKVALEMILRNQAYSNLVEIFFPNHVRLSIHAHNNAGPKFGVQLFDPSRVRVVQTLSPEGELMASLDLLHIPTPWHNCVVQLAGSEVIMVTKAKLALMALESGSMTGGLVGAEEGRAHFVLQKATSAAGKFVSKALKEHASSFTEMKGGVAAAVAATVGPDEQRRRDVVPDLGAGGRQSCRKRRMPL